MRPPWAHLKTLLAKTACILKHICVYTCIHAFVHVCVYITIKQLIPYIYATIGIPEPWSLGDNWENLLALSSRTTVTASYDSSHHTALWVLGKMAVSTRVYVAVLFVMIHVYVGHRGKENNLSYPSFNVGKFMHSI